MNSTATKPCYEMRTLVLAEALLH
eukprot:SAG25_NODE_1861_length_2244_cov_1.411189_5_plen_23_part_01